MKIVGQTSNQLIIKDSAIAAWGTRLVGSLFLLVGCIGLFIIISEKVFPNFFIIFCLIIGIIGVFFTSNKTILIDKSQNSFIVNTRRILGNKKFKYLLNEINVSVKQTPFKVKKYSGITTQKQSIYVVVLEIASHSQKIHLHGNYSFTRNEAVEIANLIRSFLNVPE